MPKIKLSRKQKYALSAVLASLFTFALILLPATSTPYAVVNLPSSIEAGTTVTLTVKIAIPSSEYLANFNPNEVKTIKLLADNTVVAYGTVTSVEFEGVVSTYGYGYGYEPTYLTNYGYAFYGYSTYTYGYGFFPTSGTGYITFTATFNFNSLGVYTINKVELCYSDNTCITVNLQTPQEITVYSATTTAPTTTATTSTTTTQPTPITVSSSSYRMPTPTLPVSMKVETNKTVTPTMPKPEVVQPTIITPTHPTEEVVTPTIEIHLPPAVETIKTKIAETIAERLKKELNMPVVASVTQLEELKKELAIQAKGQKVIKVAMVEVKLKPVEAVTVARVVNINGKTETIVTKFVNTVSSVIEYIPKDVAETADQVKWMKGVVLTVVERDPAFEVVPDNKILVYAVPGDKVKEVNNAITLEVIPELKIVTFEASAAPVTAVTENVTKPVTTQPTTQPTTQEQVTQPTTENKTNVTQPATQEQAQPSNLVLVAAIVVIAAILAAAYYISRRKE